MFRREVEGQEVRFSVLGIWGSGNVIAERDALYIDDDPTGWSMWDGRALFGPQIGTRVEKFEAFVAVLPLNEFVDRYGYLGERCEIWAGEEQTGFGCEAACADLDMACGYSDVPACLQMCSTLPRALVDCIGAADSCDLEAECHNDLVDLSGL